MTHMKICRYFLLCLVTQSAFAATVSIQCRGEGPSLDIARQDADRICLNSMATRLESDIDVKGMSVETEKDTAYHSEITRTGYYEGLSCTPSGEKIEETADQVIVRYTCQYDLSKVKRITKPYNRMPKAYKATQMVAIATVPRCESILVRGLTPRVVQCLANPVMFQMKDTDESITVRAANYLPKTVQKGDLRDSLPVYLDPAR